jgi:hydroxymethylpyrimidine/phosphomethylpyrimidine kinase
MTVVATVGTTHPLAFAGLPFAMLALAEDGVRPVCVVAGVTAQDGTRVLARTTVDPAVIDAQFSALRDAGVQAFHVGALLSADAARAVAAGLARYPGVPVVLDPVLAATGGDALGDAGTLLAIRESLLPLATVVTPNLDEAEALFEREVRAVEHMHDAARACLDCGAETALVKGGHLAGDAVDVFADAQGTRELVAPRIAQTLRGTGDLLATTLAARIAQGAPIAEAVQHARHRVREAIARGVAFAGARVASAPVSRI